MSKLSNVTEQCNQEFEFSIDEKLATSLSNHPELEDTNNESIIEESNKLANKKDDSTRKVVLITGGSSGIGLSTAIKFAINNYQVAITGTHDQKELDSILQKLIRISPRHCEEDFLILQRFFNEITQINDIIDEVIKRFNRIDVLINNAGILGNRKGIFASDFYEDFQRVQQVNLYAPVRLCQLAVPHLIKTKGVIINVSSIGDRLASRTISYNVSKSGVSMLTQCLSNALDKYQVRVAAVCPGPTLTEIGGKYMKSLGRFSGIFSGKYGRIANSNEIAELIYFLASDKASFINGSMVTVDGGFLARMGSFLDEPKWLRYIMK